MQLTLDIPDSKASFFLELLQNFSFVKVQHKNILTPQQEQQVRQTLNEMKEAPDSLSDWDAVVKRLDPDAC